MAPPHYLLRPHNQQQPNPFRNLCTIGSQISPPLAHSSPTDNLDQSHHPPFIPHFRGVGLAPGSIPAVDVGDGSGDCQLNSCYLEPKRRKLEEREFLENNSQISSIDFLGVQAVSTGLGLSLDNSLLASTGDSPVLALIDDDIDRELQRQDAEIDAFLKLQSDQIRLAVSKKIQANQVQTLTFVGEKVVQKLREKEAEALNMNKRNLELEERIEQLFAEASAWQQQAIYNENVISGIKYNLEQVYAQSRDSKEGCGESDVDDTASCLAGPSVYLHQLRKENNDIKELITCKRCRAREACMLLLPCKHLCLCKDCESKLHSCPLCQSIKSTSVEVYM
ncbi:BOI-related E3 ubiquitin-protein ligase 1-like [Malania oleifera]|uniref:BOI-related E3 ubiquitin-protein ligase 1-like n=1 Tax=Malania oleifera TaxID=397392 RepID=UPI0025AECB13|nr:BOI-related E3 ubiquitin-protein ligase 1-like [Malania oleifera]